MSFVFRRYNPYIGGFQTSFFIVLGSKGGIVHYEAVFVKIIFKKWSTSTSKVSFSLFGGSDLIQMLQRYF